MKVLVLVNSRGECFAVKGTRAVHPPTLMLLRLHVTRRRMPGEDAVPDSSAADADQQRLAGRQRRAVPGCETNSNLASKRLALLGRWIHKNPCE